MKTLSARVLDLQHLELIEPLPPTTGEWIEIVVRDTENEDASEDELELAAIQDQAEDVLTEKELSYYLALEEI